MLRCTGNLQRRATWHWRSLPQRVLGTYKQRKRKTDCNDNYDDDEEDDKDDDDDDDNNNNNTYIHTSERSNVKVQTLYHG
jgi:hypothetical protein